MKYKIEESVDGIMKGENMKVILDGKEIEEGYILKYTDFDANVTSVVKFGEWVQDGSGGEYGGTPCYGLYAEVIDINPVSWCENTKEEAEEYYDRYNRQQSVLEILRNSDLRDLEIIINK